MGSFEDKVNEFNKLVDTKKTWEQLAQELCAEIDLYFKDMTVDAQSKGKAKKLLTDIQFSLRKMLSGSH